MSDPSPETKGARSARPGPVRVLVGRRRTLFVLLTVGGLVSLAVFGALWLRVGPELEMVTFVVLSAVLAVTLINNQGRWFLLPAMRRPVRTPAPESARVAVVTTYVPSAEPADMLAESLAALVAIEYPHDTWLLDEGADPGIRALCGEIGVRYFTRSALAQYQTDDGEFQRGSKHGNYNAWLREHGFGRYDFLAAFDPDHAPLPVYLSAVLGHFADPAVAYVQPAQAFYNQSASIIARGAAEETYAYFSSVQMASFGMGYPIIVGGHNLHRMTALESVGGMAAHDADDLLLTLRYRAAGWEGVYVPEILARGLAPVDWRGYLTQQRRWARSVLDIKLRRWDTYSRDLPLSSRIMSGLHGINFLHRSLVFLLGVCLLIWLLATGRALHSVRGPVVWAGAALLAVLQLQEFVRQRFYLGGESERGTHWRVALVDFAKWPWLLLALWDVIRNYRPPYVITQKSRVDGVYRPFLAWNITLATLIAGAWIIGSSVGSPGPMVRVVAGGVVALCVVLAASALRRAPPPYRAGLRPVAPRPELAGEPVAQHAERQ